MVEFALVLPVLCVLVFGMLDFGRALNYWIDETHLANEGARWAAVDRNPGPESTLQQAIHGQIDTQELKTGGVRSGPSGSAEVCIDYPNGTSAVGDPVRVRVVSDFRFLALLGLATVDLEGEAIMRIEKVPTDPTFGETGGCYSP
jgi:Flp pilus assembly protein TadG